MRKLASMQRIAEKRLIAGADLIEAVRVNGWWVVAKKNEFQVDDLCVYFEIDAFLPIEPAFEFLRRSCFVDSALLGPGFRLRSVKLRGQLSQGLVMPLPVLDIAALPVGTDLTEALRVRKWEILADAQDDIKGAFPGYIPKTDQERVQNMVLDVESALNVGEQFEVTIKLDGSSCTVFRFDDAVGVCSRNFELQADASRKGNRMVGVAYKSGLIDALIALGKNLAVQAEVMGPGVQGNREKLLAPTLFVYGIYDIDAGRALLPAERMQTFAALVKAGFTQQHCPRIERMPGFKSIDDLLAFAEGPSLNAATREGLVFKSLTRDFSFKVIANSFLLAEQ